MATIYMRAVRMNLQAAHAFSVREPLAPSLVALGLRALIFSGTSPAGTRRRGREVCISESAKIHDLFGAELLVNPCLAKAAA